MRAYFNTKNCCCMCMCESLYSQEQKLTGAWLIVLHPKEINS